jgi:hypothetical protein
VIEVYLGDEESHLLLDVAAEHRTPESGARADIGQCLKRAKSRPEQVQQ